VVESRARRDLVLQMIMGAGNYDHLFDWVFRQDGAIRVNLAATGIDQMKAVAPRDAVADASGDADSYGSFVAPHLVAVNHSHIINFRLDFDVDGQANSLQVGFHHVARPEDWPILPLELHGFNLVPSGFFERNPPH
jgi:primary-amine oxidase